MEKLSWNIPKRQNSQTKKYLKDSDEYSEDNYVQDLNQLNEYSKRLRCNFTKNEIIPAFKDFKPSLQPTETGKKDATRLLAKVKQWAKAASGWITIIGGVGIGKTHLLKSATYEADGYYITAYDFDRRIKDFRKGMQDYNQDLYTDPDEWLDKLANAERHLVIDDIGAGYIQKGWTQSRFERLIDIRYRNQFPTAIATNFKNNQLEKELGERIVSRITDVNYSTCIILNYASDMRRIKRN